MEGFEELTTISKDYTDRRDDLLEQYDKIMTKDRKQIKEVQVLERIWNELPPNLKETEERRKVTEVIKKLSQLNSEITQRRQNLEEDSFPIIFTGEASSGKSTLLNLIIGDDVMPVHILPCTPVICHIKQDIKRCLKVWDNNRTVVNQKVTKENLKVILADYMTLDVEEKQKKSCDLVEIYWPMDNVKGLITLVDSPGISDNETINQRVLQYLPNAVAFVYVINCSNAGGIDDDRIGRIWSAQEGSGYTSSINADYAIVVCNKWDLIKERDKPDVRKYIKHKLDGNAQLKKIKEDHILELSAENAVDDDAYRESFMRFVNTLTDVMKRSIPYKLDLHEQLLDDIVGDRTNAKKDIRAIIDKERKNTQLEINQKVKSLDQLTQKLTVLENNKRKAIAEVLDDFAEELEGTINSPKRIFECMSEIDQPLESLEIVDMNKTKKEAGKMIIYFLNCSIKEWTVKEFQPMLIGNLKKKMSLIMDTEECTGTPRGVGLEMALSIPPYSERWYQKSLGFVGIHRVSEDWKTRSKRVGYLIEWYEEVCRGLTKYKIKAAMEKRYEIELFTFLGRVEHLLTHKKEEIKSQLEILKDLDKQLKTDQDILKAM